jgi:hypothetical protein
MLSSFKKSPVEQETIGCYSIFQVGSLSYYNTERTQRRLHLLTPISYHKKYYEAA